MTTPAAGAGQVGGSWEQSGDRRRHLHVAETESASSASAVSARMEGGALGTVRRMLGPVQAGALPSGARRGLCRGRSLPAEQSLRLPFFPAQTAEGRSADIRTLTRIWGRGLR